MIFNFPEERVQGWGWGGVGRGGLGTVRGLSFFLSCIKGTLSRIFFGFFGKMSPKLRHSSFNHAGNAPRT